MRDYLYGLAVLATAIGLLIVADVQGRRATRRRRREEELERSIAAARANVVDLSEWRRARRRQRRWAGGSSA